MNKRGRNTPPDPAEAWRAISEAARGVLEAAEELAEAARRMEENPRRTRKAELARALSMMGMARYRTRRAMAFLRIGPRDKEQAAPPDFADPEAMERLRREYARQLERAWAEFRDRQLSAYPDIYGTDKRTAAAPEKDGGPKAKG